MHTEATELHTERLPASTWLTARDSHLQAVLPYTCAFRERRARSISHPVYDFLFTYYTLSPAKLEFWLPPAGVLIEAADHPHYSALCNLAAVRHTADGCVLDSTLLPRKIVRAARWITRLLEATAARPPAFGCFGLHEWAMIYRATKPRHEAVPLRVSSEVVSRLLESEGVRCSHFDAYRFFTPAAKPLNVLSPTLEGRIENEQPGCIHATMDLFKWCYKLLPALPSTLLRESFFLAVAAREIDMRASPYDLSAFGFAPIKVETAEGRRQYVTEQRKLAAQGAALREKIRLLASKLRDQQA